MGDSSPEGEVHSITSIPQEDRTISNKQSISTFKRTIKQQQSPKGVEGRK